MHRQTDGLGLVGQRAFDGLLDPPGRVSGQLGPLLRVETLDPFHQADVAFIDEVEQRKAKALIVAGDFHDQAQIGPDHLLARLRVALLDAPGQFDLLFRRQQRRLTNFAQVKMKGRVSPIGTALVFQRC